MRPIWFFYIALGIIFTFLVYMTTLGTATWWHMVYYIILGFLGVMGVWSPRVRWSFIIGVIIGVGVLMFLYSSKYLTYDTRLFFLQRYIAPVM